MRLARIEIAVRWSRRGSDAPQKLSVEQARNCRWRAGGWNISGFLTRASSRVKPPAPFNRVAYAAAHVVADPLAAVDPWQGCAIDWDTTIAFRRHLWALGLGVAEAMDTAQRGMGLDWPNSLELIRRSLEAAADCAVR